VGRTKQWPQLNPIGAKSMLAVNGQQSPIWTSAPAPMWERAKAVMALVDTDTLHVDGYFEENQIARIHVGDRSPSTSWEMQLDSWGMWRSICCRH